MAKTSSKRRTAKSSPVTEVEIELRVTIKEVHSRTYTVCDKQTRSFWFDLGHDFEAVSDWLSSDATLKEMEELCLESRKWLPRKRSGS